MTGKTVEFAEAIGQSGASAAFGSDEFELEPMVIGRCIWSGGANIPDAAAPSETSTTTAIWMLST